MRWLGVFASAILITLQQLCFVEPITSVPDWVDLLNRESNGTLYFASSGVNTSELIPSYTLTPGPFSGR